MAGTENTEHRVIAAQALQDLADSVPVSLDASAAPVENAGVAFYRLLTGCPPAAADIGADDDFDRHVIASILAAAAMDGGSLAARAGLSEYELVSLLTRHFPLVEPKALGQLSGTDAASEEDETVMVRDLLLAQRSSEGDVGRWLAAMLARRAMEPNHLWEDLGLRERAELSRLLTRHFAPLAARNTRNMRWKRFFYRMLCEDDGFVMCTTPVCTQCNDFDLCFGEESGESRMAERRREFLRNADEHSDAVGGPRTA
jgi:nitrogen fixation protein NifQ